MINEVRKKNMESKHKINMIIVDGYIRIMVTIVKYVAS